MISYVILKDIAENFCVKFFLFRSPLDPELDPDPHGHFFDSWIRIRIIIDADPQH